MLLQNPRFHKWGSCKSDKKFPVVISTNYNIEHMKNRIERHLMKTAVKGGVII